jgi:hypothetical protein
LDIRSIDEYFGFLREHGFNALRIPFSLAFAKSYNEPVTSMPFRYVAAYASPITCLSAAEPLSSSPHVLWLL